MFNAAKRSSLFLKATRIASVPRLGFAARPTLSQLSTFVGRRQILLPQRNINVRAYSTAENDGKTVPPELDAEVPHDGWVSILENTVSSPWLAVRPPTPERILERAFTLILQILLSLNMPRDPEAAQAFFFAFENAPVAPDSDIGRGRRAIATLARVTVDDITSIPESSPLRNEHPKLFALHGALVPLVDAHLRDPSGEISDWKAFWTRAEAPLFELNSELHNSGFGMDLEELLKAKEEEEEAAKKS